jgi:hypothetical protein
MSHFLLSLKFLLLSCLWLSVSALADTKKCEFRSGCMGRLYLGQSSANIEKLVGHPIEFHFVGKDDAGSEKGGGIIVAEKDITNLRLPQHMGTKIKAVDVIVTTKSIKPFKAVTSFIGAGIPCDVVDKLRAESEKDGFKIKEIPAGQGWRAFNSKYTWGAGKFPVCNFFMETLPPGFKW